MFGEFSSVGGSLMTNNSQLRKHLGILIHQYRNAFPFLIQQEQVMTNILSRNFFELVWLTEFRTLDDIKSSEFQICCAGWRCRSQGPSLNSCTSECEAGKQAVWHLGKGSDPQPSPLLSEVWGGGDRLMKASHNTQCSRRERVERILGMPPLFYHLFSA